MAAALQKRFKVNFVGSLVTRWRRRTLNANESRLLEVGLRQAPGSKRSQWPLYCVPKE
jgi:hypothetical protein